MSNTRGIFVVNMIFDCKKHHVTIAPEWESRNEEIKIQTGVIHLGDLKWYRFL